MAKNKTMNNEKDYLVGLDVGSSKVLCVVAELVSEGDDDDPESLRYRIAGYGRVDSDGIEKGIVAEVNGVVRAIQAAVKEASLTASVNGPINSAWVAIGGSYLTSENAKGVAVVRGKEVAQSDIDAAEVSAREHSFRKGRELIKMIPQGYKTGDVESRRSPLGLVGDRVEAHYHAIYGSITNAENMKRCLQRSGIDLANYVPHPWASAQAVLTQAEKVGGTLLIDMGKETTSLAYFYEDVVRFTCVKPYGADLITRDIAIVFGLRLEQAEELKIRIGHCHPEREDKDMTVHAIELKGQASGPKVDKRLLAQTIRSRAEEVLGIFKKDLADEGLLVNVRNIVITGGGAHLQGIDDVARAVFGAQVRLGYPRKVEGARSFGSMPEASVALGLIEAAARERVSGGTRTSRRKSLQTLWEKVQTFFTGEY